MRLMALFMLTLGLAGGTAAAQTSLDASAYTYIVADGENYVKPTVAADRGWWHVEVRFNYEDRDTGSAWVGYNFSVGSAVTLEITPIIGAVIGTPLKSRPVTRPR